MLSKTNIHFGFIWNCKTCVDRSSITCWSKGLDMTQLFVVMVRVLPGRIQMDLMETLDLPSQVLCCAEIHRQSLSSTAKELQNILQTEMVFADIEFVSLYYTSCCYHMMYCCLREHHIFITYKLTYKMRRIYLLFNAFRFLLVKA